MGARDVHEVALGDRGFAGLEVFGGRIGDAGDLEGDRVGDRAFVDIDGVRLHFVEAVVDVELASDLDLGANRGVLPSLGGIDVDGMFAIGNEEAFAAREDTGDLADDDDGRAICHVIDFRDGNDVGRGDFDVVGLGVLDFVFVGDFGGQGILEGVIFFVRGDEEFVAGLADGEPGLGGLGDFIGDGERVFDGILLDLRGGLEFLVDGDAGRERIIGRGHSGIRIFREFGEVDDGVLARGLSGHDFLFRTRGGRGVVAARSKPKGEQGGNDEQIQFLHDCFNLLSEAILTGKTMVNTQERNSRRSRRDPSSCTILFDTYRSRSP